MKETPLGNSIEWIIEKHHHADRWYSFAFGDYTAKRMSTENMTMVRYKQNEVLCLDTALKWARAAQRFLSEVNVASGGRAITLRVRNVITGDVILADVL